MITTLSTSNLNESIKRISNPNKKTPAHSESTSSITDSVNRIRISSIIKQSGAETERANSDGKMLPPNGRVKRRESGIRKSIEVIEKHLIKKKDVVDS
jgi:hypothetical protein